MPASTGRSVARRDSNLLLAAYGLLLAAWVWGFPFSGGPDEPAHYTKAVGVALGQPQGVRQPAPSGRWTDNQLRSFEIPGRLRVRKSDSCFRRDPRMSAACSLGDARPGRKQRSHVGSYEPGPYVVPGLAARLAGSAPAAFHAARAANAAVVLLLLGTALTLTASGDRVRLAGLVAGVTPMVIFLGAHVQPNAMEIAGALCFAAATLRIVRGPAPGRTGPQRRAGRTLPSTPAVWGAAAASGIVTVASRPFGILWILLTSLLAIVDRGPAAVWQTMRAGGRWAVLAVSSVLVAVGMTLIWDIRVQPSPSLDLSFSLRVLPDVVASWPELLKEKVAVFGFLNVGGLRGKVGGLMDLRVALPWPGYAMWWIVVTVILVSAFIAGSRRERALLSGLCICVAACSIALEAVVFRPAGWASQGRYTLPLAVVVPLYAAEVLARKWWHLDGSRLRLLGLVAPAAATVHAVAWYINARRYAVGIQGPWLFLGRSEWAPPGGWPGPFALAITGALLLALAGARDWFGAGSVGDGRQRRPEKSPAVGRR